MRKFKVEYEVTTDDKGFIPYGSVGWRTATLHHGISSVEIPPSAKATELKILEDGYYYYGRSSASTTRFLYKREDGIWFFRSVGDQWAETTLKDGQMDDTIYLGPLRDGV